MKMQYNKQTRMYWVYVSTAVARLLNLKKGDDVEFKAEEKTNKVEFRKIIKEDSK